MQSMGISQYIVNKKWPIVRINYVGSQGLSTLFALAGSLFTFYDKMYPSIRSPENSSIYISIFSVSTIAAIIAAGTAYKFQGMKIGTDPKENNGIFKYPYEIAPREWRTNAAELIYLIFSMLLLLVNNYFLLAAIKASCEAFENPDQIYPLLPIITPAGLTILGIKCAIDAIFNLTNAFYEAAEEIKEDLTDSKAGSLVSKLCEYLTYDYTYKPTLFCIKSLGVLSHTFTDYSGLLLCVSGILDLIVQPGWFIKLYQAAPVALVLAALIFTAVSVPLIIVNFIQTLYFEAKESEINLKQLRTERILKQFGIVSTDIEYCPDLDTSKENTNFLRTLLTWKPSFKKTLRYGFFSQGILHAFGDSMPVTLFLRDLFFNRFKSINIELGVTTIFLFTAYVMGFSTYGTHQSEVKTAIRNYDKEFSDINESEEGAKALQPQLT